MAASRAPTGPYGRAPKGDGGLNSRACLRIQFTYWVGGAMVERLRTLWSSEKSMAASRAPTGPLLSMAALTVEHLKVLMVEPPKG